MAADLIPFRPGAGKGEFEARPGGPPNALHSQAGRRDPHRTSDTAIDPLPPSTFSPEVAKILDRLFNAHVANFTGGTDPRVIPLAYLDWAVKLAWSPGTHARLTEKALRKAVRLAIYTAQVLADPDAPPAIEPLPQDKRFISPGWQQWPYNLMSQSFLLTQQWWANATTGVPALSRERKKNVTIVTRQMLDLVSPANFPWTNPEVRDATLREGGANLLRGWANWRDDLLRLARGEKPAGAGDFQPGIDVAKTPGRVVYRNHLIELIQYAPTLSLIHISEPTRRTIPSRMPSSA